MPHYKLSNSLMVFVNSIEHRRERTLFSNETEQWFLFLWFYCGSKFQKVNQKPDQKMRQDTMSSFGLIIRIGSDNTMPPFFVFFFVSSLC